MLSKITNKPSLILYTLYQNTPKTPYVVHISNKDDQYKTTLVSLLHKRDIQKIGNVLENHKKKNGVYPRNTFNSDTLFSFDIDIDDNAAIKPLQELSIKRWTQEDLILYCVDNWIDLMIIEDLKENSSIQVIEFEIPHEYTIERLNKSLL